MIGELNLIGNEVFIMGAPEGTFRLKLQEEGWYLMLLEVLLVLLVDLCHGIAA